MTQRRILITAALPYANGPIHIGHLLEYIQTDIWSRFQKLRGHNAIFVCADDTHGTAITKSARAKDCTEEEFIAAMSEAHQRDFAGFQIEFDNYGSTHSPENREYCGQVWQALKDADLVSQRVVEQFYDVVTGESLPDRFIKGKCPKCEAPDQYGDNCDKCGHTYRATDVIDPISTVSGKPPKLGSAEHFFVNVERLHGFLDEWTQSGNHLQTEVANYLKGHFLGEELRDWDVSRPAPYFGFEIPATNNEHFWYVWFDAPIGYIASTRQWCDRHGEEIDAWWKNPETEIHHFLGKDITYFHTLFWPAMLKTAGLNLPTKVHIHGFVNVGGEKMSKSKGTFVMAETYLRHLDPAYLRYYYASKLGPRLEDLDLNLGEFITKVNSDLVGKVVNLASRSAKFLADDTLSVSYPDDGGLFQAGAEAGESIAAAYENCDYNAAMRKIMALADSANKYVEDREPWKLRKDEARQEELRDVCTVALNLFRQIVIYLAPVLPKLASQTAELLNTPITTWSEAQTPLMSVRVGRFQHMMKRIEEKQVHAMIEESKIEEPAESEFNDGPEALEKEPLAEECTIDDFVKVDMRVARVIEAEAVPEADKLLRLKLSLGGDVQRNVFAGIKAAYKPEDLVGRLVICCANLKPRKMRFGVSEGMVLASGGGGKEVFVLSPDDGAVPGQRVH
ncbi:MAG: methionine--tRNA ligase [Pirellulales bacterium]|nr:methionine--tRNA ligase [Pirellulales bacterium]